LRNEELIRPLELGNNWTKLRIAALVGVGVTSTLAGVLDIGVCTAGNRGIGSGNPDNYIGSGMGGGVGSRLVTPLLTFATVAGGWGAVTGRQHYTTIAGATVAYGVSAGTYYIGTTLDNAGVYKRMLTVVDIERVSSVLCNVRQYSQANSGIQYDMGEIALVQACENSFGPFSTSAIATVPAYSLVTFTTTALTFNTDGNESLAWQESAGPLDAVNIAWSSSAVDCAIWGIAVAKHQ
jgi:hypothetical protein